MGELVEMPGGGEGQLLVVLCSLLYYNHNFLS